MRRCLRHQTLSDFPCVSNYLLQLHSPAWAGDTRARIMLLSGGYQGLFLHFDYMNIAPTMLWLELPSRNLRAATSIRKSQGAIRVGVLQCQRSHLYMNSLMTKRNLPNNAAKKETGTYTTPLSLRQQASILVNPFHGYQLSLRKQHCLVSPAVLHHKGDLHHDAAKYLECKTRWIDWGLTPTCTGPF